MSFYPEREYTYSDEWEEAQDIVVKASKYGVRLNALTPIRSLRAAFNFNGAIKESHTWTKLK